MIDAAPSVSSRPGIRVVSSHGWDKNLRLANEAVELIASLEVGPRILVYRQHGGFNPLNVFTEQAGRTGEDVWRNRGGHRLWAAPEHPVTTYFPDNAPVEWRPLGELHVLLRPPPETSNRLQKEIEIQLDPVGTGVTLIHRLTNLGRHPMTLAPWAISVMAAGGMAVVPQPALGEHPRDLLPNRNLVLWPYTDMTDRRWHWGRHFILLRQDAAHGPTKAGLSHQPGWSGYWAGGVFFLKRYAWDPFASYPDRGCNLELFTNARMLELESLGPLTRLPPGRSVEHRERWELHSAPALPLDQAEEQVQEFLGPVLDASNLAPVPKPNLI
jgi:hypothetical protein